MERQTRHALVTGGVGGIGAAACSALARDGLRLTVADLNASGAKAIAAELPGEGHSGIGMDVADEASVMAGFDAAERAGGTVSVLVNSAGLLLFKPDGDRPLLVETDLAHWQRMLDVNTTGCFLVCREFARRAPAHDALGRVVTISSVAAQLGGYRSSAAYIASKSAILGLTKAMTRELAPRGITANCVAPGLIDTAMLRLSLDAADDSRAAAAIPLNRLGLPEDVAETIRFLVSPGAGYLTGLTVDVNGGYRMQ